MHFTSLVKFLCTTATCDRSDEFHCHDFFNVAFWLQALFHSQGESILDEIITTVLSTENNLKTLCLGNRIIKFTCDYCGFTFNNAYL